ncbi:uracil/xanthine transporter [Paenibacillus thalictri]|uniref:Uracil/xanthine transporter n=1 Tax=Paenibacillus thalictri TaxID=2527873 RepID=A0A4V2J3W5_9BACL|nr:uracil/xanthine transporter [Paenibacillus thalictri]TBL76020.1 uracil/xanthine transporter [Paenibacillus thalictri]
MLKNIHVTTGIAGLQWLFYIFTNTVVVPLSIGHAFQLPMTEIAGALQRSFILTGILCVLQAWIGHRYAVMDGASGVWWGLTLNLCASASAAGMSLSEVGGGLASGFLLSSLLMIVLGLLGFGSVLQRMFTPVVKGVFLLLLTIQLTMNFFKGMLGVTAGETVQLPVAALSIGLALLTALLHLKGRGLISNFSILIGIIAGWLAYRLLFPHIEPVETSAGALVTLFPWGTPNLQVGIILTACFVGLINMTNTVTCLSSVEKLYKTQTTEGQYKRSYVLTGLFSVFSSLFGLLPFGVFTSSIGFLESTRILRRSAMIIGAGLIAVLGLVPAASRLLSTLPPTVGNAVLFVAYLQMFGTALRSFQTTELNSKTVYRVAAPVLLGISIMNIPPQAFAGLPLFISPLVSNGLVMGVLLALVLEIGVNWGKLSVSPPQSQDGETYQS